MKIIEKIKPASRICTEIKTNQHGNENKFYCRGI